MIYLEQRIAARYCIAGYFRGLEVVRINFCGCYFHGARDILADDVNMNFDS